LNQDKFEGWKTNPASLNSFAYAHANPIAWIDPSGFGLLDQAILIYVVYKSNPYVVAVNAYCASVTAAVVIYHTARIIGGSVGPDLWESGLVGCGLNAKLLNYAFWQIPALFPPMPIK